MDGQHLEEGKLINFLYEFRTPNGYLPIGFDHKQIGVIFDIINNKEWDSSTTSIRLGYDGYFKILKEASSAYDVLNFEETYTHHTINQKCVDELCTWDLENAINVFSIVSHHDEPITQYVSTIDFTNILLPETVKLFQRENFKILILDNKEGAYHHDFEFFDNIKKLYNHLNVNKDNQIIYVTNSSDILKKYQTYLIQTKQKSFMKVKNIEFLIYDAGEPMTNYYDTTHGKSLEVIYEQGVGYSIPLPDELNLKREKYFLNLNRNSGRFHRPRFVLELIKNQLFDKGLISLLQTPEFDEWAELPENQEYKTLIKDKYPFVVDYENERFVSGMHNFFTKKDMWLNTYFSIVAETSAEDDWIFITEKTVRPMIYYHPFIMWGNPGTLDVLKRHGFKTFPEFFDESYDRIENQELRLQKVIENVERLCSLPLDKIHEMYLSVLPKLIHNHDLLIKLYQEQTKNITILNLLIDNEVKPNI
jgi:hypothetical protein